MDKQVQVTKQGYDTLVSELESLEQEKRPLLVKRLSRARAEGDLSENSDYQNARDELEFMDGKIQELKHVLKNAKVVKTSSKDEVCIGKCVHVQVNGSKNTFDIVGEWEADPAQKKISHSSPLGQALVGKKKGDEVEVEAPAGKITYKILKIE